MLPHGLPLCISRLRRANILLRSSYVLLSNAELAPSLGKSFEDLGNDVE